MPSSHRLTQQTIQKRGASVPKVDFQEMLYLLFKQLWGSTNGLPTDVSIGDKDVFTSSPLFAYLISEAKSTDKDTENFKEYDLICSLSNLRVEDPVIIPGSNLPFDRNSVLEKIQDEEPSLVASWIHSLRQTCIQTWFERTYCYHSSPTLLMFGKENALVAI